MNPIFCGIPEPTPLSLTLTVFDRDECPGGPLSLFVTPHTVEVGMSPVARVCGEQAAWAQLTLEVWKRLQSGVCHP